MVRSLTNESKRSDIIAARDAWDAEAGRKNAEINDMRNRYRQAVYEVGDNLKAVVEKSIGNTTLSLKVDVDPWGARYGSDSYRVLIDANDAKKFDDNVALAWNWSVYLDSDGNVVKESSSWSGLKAVTPDQLVDLEETLRVLKVLNSLDWGKLIEQANSNKPNYTDYVTPDESPMGKRPNFEDQLKEAAIEEIIGTNTLIKSAGKAYRGESWFLIVGQTAKQYKVYEFSDWAIDRIAAGNNRDYATVADYIKVAIRYAPEAITKEKFFRGISGDPQLLEF